MGSKLNRVISMTLTVILVVGMMAVGFTASADTQTKTLVSSEQQSITAETTLNEDGSLTVSGTASVWGWLSSITVIKGDAVPASVSDIKEYTGHTDAVASKSFAAGAVAIGSKQDYSFTLNMAKITTTGYTVVAVDSNNTAWAMCYVTSPAGTQEGVGGKEEEETGGDTVGDGTIDVTAVKNADGSVTFAGTVALGNYVDKIVFKKGNTMDQIELTYASGTILSSWAPNHTTLLGTVHSGNSVTFSVTFIEPRDISEVGYTIVTKDRWEGTPYTAKFIPTQGGTGVDENTYYGKGVSDSTLKSWCTIAKNNKQVQCLAVNSVQEMLRILGEPARTKNADAQELIDYYSSIKPNEYQYDEYFLNDYYVQGVWDTMPANYGWMQDQYTTPGKWVAEHYNLGQRAYGISLGGNNPWVMLDYIERNIGVANANTDGWLYGYDEETENPYLWHKETGMFLTYENKRSLQARIDYINKNNLGGCIIWEMSGDNTDTYPLTKMLYEGTGKRVVGYFVNWAVYNDYHQKQSPTDLPWDIMTHINYSFMQIENNKIASMDDWADTTGATDYGAPAMFEKVAMMKELYPDTKVLLSVGGWTRGDTFHEMVSSAANRKIFVDSVVEYLKKYPQFDGIDLDWEYPGTSPRAADHDDPNDRGCPTGTEADFENYTSIVTELRAALDANFSTTGQNIVTVCMPGDPNKIDRQNIVEITNACDFVNIMTYDYHGAFDPVGSVYENGVKTDKYWSLGYNSPLYSHEDTPNEWSTDLTVQYLLSKGIPAEKMNIGTPYYSRGWAGIPTITQDGMEVPAGIADKTPFDTPDKDYDHGSSNVAVSGITVTPETAALTVGGTTTATATVTPDNATDKTVTWTTDNRDVATVDANGVITAVAEGTATITAKTSNGLTDTCFVTVNAAQANQMYSIIKIGTTNAYNNFYGTFGLDQAPMVVDNKAYIPLRNATQLLYASIEDYNDATDEFYVVFSTFKAKMQIGSQKVDFYTPDGTYAFSDNLPEGQTPIIVDGKAYLPARQLATIASMDSGRQVEYISNSQGEYVAFIMGASATMSEVEAMVATAQGYIG